MKAGRQRVLLAACCAMLSISMIAIGDDDDKAADARQQSAQPSLNSEQQHAVGIVVAHPLAAKAPERIEALGLVLDATTLISDLGELPIIQELAAGKPLSSIKRWYAGESFSFTIAVCVK